jgi:microcin C transport system permease protein
MTNLSPQTRRQLKRFRSLKRGYASFLALLLLAAISLGAELLVNSRALLVHYRGRTYFTAYGAIHTGREFGYDYDYEADYRGLRARFAAAKRGDWVLLAPLPYGPNENCYPGENFKPRPPDFANRHYLGTDEVNRDILARLLYGLRNSLIFSAGFVVLTYLIGVALGCAMGFFGGKFDLGMQRFIEIWSLLPFLLVVIIVRAALPAGVGFGLGILLAVVVIFSWTSMTYYVRSSTYREKAREYVAAARVLGANPARVVFRHILPNILSTLITFLPFTIAAAIASLAALDFLGFGLPPPMPSWGELLKQGTDNLDAPWIVASAFGALSIVLVLITFVGEAIREAFDPKKFTVYK